MDNNTMINEMDINLEDLEAEIGLNDLGMESKERTVLSQNLEGFASCFPDWDLTPPRR